MKEVKSLFEATGFIGLMFAVIMLMIAVTSDVLFNDTELAIVVLRSIGILFPISLLFCIVGATRD